MQHYNQHGSKVVSRQNRLKEKLQEKNSLKLLEESAHKILGKEIKVHILLRGGDS